MARPVRYSYALPAGDTSNAQDDGVVYMHLLAGDCATAQVYLDATWDRLYQYYGGPRAVVMFQAAIEMCTGDEVAARRFVDLAGARFGWAGLARDQYSCNIYRATQSVWRQVPPPDVDCPAGDIPPWPDDRTCDDPRTESDECTSASPTTAAPGDDETPTTPSATTTPAEPPTGTEAP